MSDWTLVDFNDPSTMPDREEPGELYRGGLSSRDDIVAAHITGHFRMYRGTITYDENGPDHALWSIVPPGVASYVSELPEGLPIPEGAVDWLVWRYR